MTIQPLVSIIMPAYNAYEHISLSIESVVQQTYTNWELIIIDDKSTDETLKMASSLAVKDSRIKLYRLERNSGVALARNFGVVQATGKYLAFLDSDDLWLPNKLELQIRTMQKSNATFSCTGYYRTDSTSKRIGVITPPPTLSLDRILKTNDIGCLTVIYDCHYHGKRFFKEIGHEDYALWLELLKDKPVAIGIRDILASYRVSSHSLSANKFKAAMYQWYIYRREERLSFLRSTWIFFNYVLIGIYKRLARV